MRYPETGYNRLLDDFFSKTKMTVNMKLNNWNTNCNYHLLSKLDKSETMGKITCIPIGYLRKEHGEKGVHYDNEEYEKKKLFSKFLEDKHDISSLSNITYNGVELSKFYKPYLLQADLTKTIDYAKLDAFNNDLEKELGMTIGIYNKELITKPRLVNRNEWMSNNDIKEFMKKIITDDDDIYFVDIIYIERRRSFFDTSSTFYHSYYYQQLLGFQKSKKRFLLSMVLYNSHFNAIVVDKNFKRKNKNGIIYMFDSQGYDSETIRYNKNFFFLDSSMEQKKQQENDFENNSTAENYHVDIISDFFNKEFGIDLLLLNKFVIQLLNSECGMFSMIFLYLNVLNKPYNIHSSLKNYMTMMFKGDLTVSEIRGLFFVTNEDASYDEYMNNLGTYEIKNRKYLEFIKLEEKKKRYLSYLFRRE